MKSSLFILVTAAVLFGALVASIPSGAQEHPRYKLIDMGTFGGPGSSIVDPGVPGGVYVNNAGVFVGFADTREADPFPNFCFLDCYVDHAFQSQGGGMMDLGVLHAGLSSAPVAISGNGFIAGIAQNGEMDPLFAGFPEQRGVLWRNGKITDLGTLPEGGYESSANSVNSHAQVVGYALNTIPDPNSFASIIFNNLAGSTESRAFLWEGDGMQDLGTLGGPDAAALLINERGQVMGWSYTSATEPGVCFPLAIGSFVWEKETGMRNIGSFGGTCTVAQNLNDRGQIVGITFPPDSDFGRAFLWEHDSFRELGGSIGGEGAGAFAVNDEGVVVGVASIKGNTDFHATLWTKDGQIKDLGTVSGDPCSSAKAINNRGQVVGDSISLANCLGNGEATRAFFWDGTMFDLNDLIPAGSPLYLVHPQTINDRGEIAGFGVDKAGNQHAFLLIPCDQNHSGLEDCDCSLVGASELTQSAPPSNLYGSTAFERDNPEFSGAFNPESRINHHRPPRNRILAQAADSTLKGFAAAASVAETKCSSHTVDNDDALLEPATSSLRGHCVVEDGKLTGSCVADIHVGPSGCIVKASSACSSGAKPKRPGAWECCGLISCGHFTVDLATSCSP